jgi:hypothetical protein
MALRHIGISVRKRKGGALPPLPPKHDGSHDTIVWGMVDSDDEFFVMFQGWSYEQNNAVYTIPGSAVRFDMDEDGNYLQATLKNWRVPDWIDIEDCEIISHTSANYRVYMETKVV